VTLEPSRSIVVPALTFPTEMAPSPCWELFTATAEKAAWAVASPFSTMSPPVEARAMELEAFKVPALTPPPVRVMAPPWAVTSPSPSAPVALTLTWPPAVSAPV
jgi:hypothetical protein